MKIKPTKLLLSAVIVAGSIVANAQPIGQWDFENANLTGTVGGDLTYTDGAGGVTEQGTVFGTTTSLGIPDIAGTSAKVMKFPAAASLGEGYTMMVNAPPSDGGGLVNTYTLILDLLFPATSDGKWRAIYDADYGVLAPDAEFFVNPDGGIGIGGLYSGQILPNTWHRVAVVVNGAANEIRKYIDGVLVGTQNAAGIDGRFSLNAFGPAWLFTDNDGETAPGYVNSIQLRATALSSAQIRAIGAASAAGIPQEIPPIPSGIDLWIPAGAFASRDTFVGGVIDIGSTTIQDSSITLKVNGTTVANRTVTRAGDRITVQTPAALSLNPGSTNTIEISYTDSLAGQKTFTRQFVAALFFEDFESVVLGESVEEAPGTPNVWSKLPPAGWTTDDTKMAGFGGPDDDADGRPDGDGMSEWFGWSFAKKDWWVQVAGDQRRSEFTLSTGVSAIADPDEWDDRNHDQGLFNSLLTTPEISLAGVGANSAFLKFFSSWRPEANDDGPPKFPEGNINNQTAIISVSYDGGAPVQVLKWDSVSGSPTFHPDMPNETVLVPLNNPPGAQKMQLTFALVQAANDWWWAIDDVVINAGAAPPAITQNPSSIEVTEGATASLSVTASGDGLNYQWFKGHGLGRVALQGATSATLNFPTLNIQDAGYYSVEVRNSAGTITSGTAKITVLPNTSNRLVLLDENFDSLPLGPNVDEALAGEAVWTKTPPSGWSIDDSGVPGAGTDQDGVTEWAGWSFANREWWAQTAGDQQRSLFTKGTGTSAIADSDEWDDIGHDPGNMSTLLKTKSISLQGVKPNSVVVKYDSSWRPENPQKASVAVSFDGAMPIDLIRYHSDPNNADYRPDEVNETISLRVNNPPGAQNMQLIFRYYDTRNNWWWAFDNLLVLGDRAPIFFEDFESLVLGPNVDEGLAGTEVWTSTPPTGWSVDNTNTPGIGDPNVGVREWEGWNFAKREWWASTAGNQRRSEFVKGVGTVAIADGDEWDDKGSPASLGKMNTFLSTRSIDISSAPANRLVLKFDSSWRDEPDQKANIRVSYDGAAPIEVLRWESVSGQPNFHDDAPNESVSVPLRNPPGARNMVITFGYLDAGNNWWWAIDNVEVTLGPEEGTELRISSITRTGNQITLNWNGGAGIKLQKGSALALPINWSDVAGSEGNSTVTVGIEGDAAFFRVIKP